MSRSIKIRRPRWTDPEDRAYLSFLGTLLKGFKMEEVRVLRQPFNLKRKTAPFRLSQMNPARRLFIAPVTPLSISDAQTATLKSIASVAQKSRFEPKALPSPSHMLTIEMIKETEDKVPVYVRRKK